MTSTPEAFSSRAFWVIAMVADGFTRERASARKPMADLRKVFECRWARKMFPGIGALVIMRRGTGKRGEREAASRLPSRSSRGAATATTLRPAAERTAIFLKLERRVFQA
ncbi:hypothetical protein GCM10008965_30300 [Methylorubrum aminovorans]|nr:hypothetical protein GCM10025880_50340 [Methylorubrum aminovorans]